MRYISHYDSPVGAITLEGCPDGLTGLWFDGQKYFPELSGEERELNVLVSAKEWLGEYFSGKCPTVNVPIVLSGSDFRLEVWEILRTIPYGHTMTYGEIARKIAEKRGVSRISAQAVGGAVGHNPISLIVPCHRVIGSDGSLTGYAGGLERKSEFLRIEGIMHKK